MIQNGFKGFGPRFGIDTHVDVARHVQAVASAAGAILIGKHEWRHKLGDASANNDEDALIPEVDYHLGARYNYTFKEIYTLGLEAGYQVAHYFDIVDKTDEVLTGGNGQRDDWAYNGGYLRIDLTVI